jgi:hypothetical protein
MERGEGRCQLIEATEKARDVEPAIDVSGDEGSPERDVEVAPRSANEVVERARNHASV